MLVFEACLPLLLCLATLATPFSAASSVSSLNSYANRLMEILGGEHKLVKREVLNDNETDYTIALLNNVTDIIMTIEPNLLANETEIDLTTVTNTTSVDSTTTTELTSTEMTTTTTFSNMTSISQVLSTETTVSPSTRGQSVSTSPTTTIPPENNTTSSPAFVTQTSLPSVTTSSYVKSTPSSTTPAPKRYDGSLRDPDNNTWWLDEHCEQLSQAQLVEQLKEKGTYNPDLMAWDRNGLIRFLEKTTVSTYDSDPSDLKKNTANSEQNAAVENNLMALERILRELNVPCDVRSPEVVERMKDLTSKTKKELINFRRAKREVANNAKSSFNYYYTRNKYLRSLYDYHTSLSNDEVVQTINLDRDEHVEMTTDTETATTQMPSSSTTLTPDEIDGEESNSTTVTPPFSHSKPPPTNDDIIGTVHVFPNGCEKRGSRQEGGYLRLCGVCQAIRRLPDNFFPPFINEVLCDEDKACLYFYDYPHGKCKQKHMNFVVLKNIGTPHCQIWRKFNINVRVSCECFVDEMSFFSKYV